MVWLWLALEQPYAIGEHEVHAHQHYQEQQNEDVLQRGVNLRQPRIQVFQVLAHVVLAQGSGIYAETMPKPRQGKSLRRKFQEMV